MKTNHVFPIPILFACLLTASNAVMAQETGANLASVSTEERPIQQKARLRAFGQNGVSVDVYPNSVCIGGNAQKIRTSGNWGDAFSSFLGTVKNTSIGMKQTPNTENLSQRGGFASKPYFVELEVPANQPVSVRMDFGNISGVKCGSIGGTFTPEPGKEYELALNWRGDLCVADVQEIQQDESGKVVMQNVPTRRTPKCE